MSNDGLTSHREPGAFVTFLIGKESDPPKTFLVHKEFACHASPVFDAAFNSNFIEGQTQTYKLDDTTPRAFRLLTQWIYLQKLTMSQLKGGVENWNPEESSKDERRAIAHEFMTLVELWVLADKLRIPRLQNLVIDTIHAIEEKTLFAPSPLSLRYIYENTAPGSQLRLFAVEISISGLQPKDFIDKRVAKDMPHQMLLDFAAHTSQKLEELETMHKCNSPPHDLSAYHVPVDEEPKA
jgi:hypothetical protein